ncbi:MAG: beta-lactamase family protein, partial [Ilumatobacteraceae bacterium]|nr:beta-lactamase family protein [Ilumatobacteraceae bacterium]
MARRVWVIGGIGVAMVALVSTSGSSDQTAAKSVSTPEESAVRPTTSSEATTSTTPMSTTTTIADTTTTESSTTTTTTTPPSTTTTFPQSHGTFNGAAFDTVIAASTVDIGDISVGAAVLRHGTVLHTMALGMETPFESKAATTRTRFRLASVSKMLTAVAIMQLVNEGSIQLDEPFAGQLGLDGPFADPRVATVTVRELMSHTSGFGAAHGIFFGHGVDTWKQAADNALGQTLLSDPGTAFKYSNTNFCLLGLLIESVTGQSFDNAIRERVLKPIGINAHLAPTFDTLSGDAMHASSPGRNYMETLGPAGGWVATPLDVAKLADALRPESPGPHLLDELTVDKMRVSVTVPVETPPPANGWSYGLGLMLFGDGSWGHTGTIESTHAVVVNRPDGLTVAILVSGKEPDNTD